MLTEPGSPVVALPYPESAARALAFACERSDWLERAPGTTHELDVDDAAGRSVVESALAGSRDSWLPPQQIRKLLEAYGIPFVPERIAHTADEAEAAARELGFPAVVKTAVPGVHKTDIGGVALDLRDSAQVRAAVDLDRAARDRPAVPRRRDGTSRRRRSGPGLRPARRLRARRRESPS